MAKIIKTDNTFVRNLRPENGVAFSFDEVRNHIKCERIFPFYLDGGYVFICDGDAYEKAERVNITATNYLYFKMKDWCESEGVSPLVVAGDVFICKLFEFVCKDYVSFEKSIREENKQVLLSNSCKIQIPLKDIEDEVCDEESNIEECDCDCYDQIEFADENDETKYDKYLILNLEYPC